jgi:hypothetical protein
MRILILSVLLVGCQPGRIYVYTRTLAYEAEIELHLLSARSQQNDRPQPEDGSRY